MAIARALALEPSYLLFDEPTSALDPELEAEVIPDAHAAGEGGPLLVIVTHNMAFAKKVADRIVFLETVPCGYNGEPNEASSPRTMTYPQVPDRVRQHWSTRFGCTVHSKYALVSARQISI